MSDEHDMMLTETIARHFEGAVIKGNRVDLGVAGVSIECQVNGIREIGETRSASLFFHLWGGQLGDTPIFASMSGYGASAGEAVVTGGCNWACTFGPVLESALEGQDPGEAERFETQIHGRKFVGVVDGLDRAMFYGNDQGGDISERVRAARAHIGAAPWLTTKIIDSGTLPELPADLATVLSVFCWESAEQRTLEVKVNGADWKPASHILDDIAPIDGSGAALLRELAVLVPQEAAKEWSRDRLSQTLEGAALSDEARRLLAWPGWSAHDGHLGEPASELDLERLESKIGTLPKDYRDYLLSVAGDGAGPGYGLLSPFSHSQREMATGEFDWADGHEPSSAPSGVLVLAHAGCGVMWLLVTSGPHRGEVWVDAAGSDGRARRVAPSFEAWYRGWIDALVRDDELFAQWDADCCATSSVLSQMLDSMTESGIAGNEAIAELPNLLAPGAIGLSSGGWTYFDQGDPLDPCQSCCNLVNRLGISSEVFKPGALPKQARKKPDGLLGRLFGRGLKQ